MIPIKLFLLSAFLISISNEGPCAITTRSEKYTKCRDKAPTDERNNVCCYLKAQSSSGEIKHCVEMRRLDIKKDRFKTVKDQIKAGTYDYWLMDNYTGFEEYKAGMTFSKLDSIRCSNSYFLKNFKLYAILFILISFI